MSGVVKRAARVAERLREELAGILRGLRDPRIEGVIVTRVELTDDLQTAKIYVRRGFGVSGEAAEREMLRGLAAASGRMRRDLSQALALRYAPTLKFYYDEAPDAVDRVEELLREIKTEHAGKGGEG